MVSLRISAIKKITIFVKINISAIEKNQINFSVYKKCVIKTHHWNDEDRWLRNENNNNKKEKKIIKKRQVRLKLKKTKREKQRGRRRKC